MFYVKCQKVEEKRSYFSESRYLNNAYLKLESLDIKWKETGKSLNNLPIDVLWVKHYLHVIRPL